MEPSSSGADSEEDLYILKKIIDRLLSSIHFNLSLEILLK